MTPSANVLSPPILDYCGHLQFIHCAAVSYVLDTHILAQHSQEASAIYCEVI